MDICAHCHNVLSKNIQRCTVCGTERVDPAAADTRRREAGRPSHAPGWAAPAVPDVGLHPDDFLRELSGDEAAPPPAPDGSAALTPVLPPRASPTTPPPGALAGYLGANIHREPSSESPARQSEARPANPAQPPPGAGPSAEPTAPAPEKHFGQHLSTATNVTPDGVAARTTRLDGTVKLGPTNAHRTLVLGAPLLAALILIASIAGAYETTPSAPAGNTEETPAEVIETTALTAANSAIVRLDLDGCGVLDQATGILFADQSILVTRSSVKTDNRPTVVRSDGSTHAAEIVGWSQVRNLAVVRSDEAQLDGLSWGVSTRISEGDVVSVLAITGPGIAEPVPATVVTANKVGGINMSFELDVQAAEGSVVLDSNGFAIGIFDTNNRALASDDVAPAISRIRLSNDRPPAECPAPVSKPTTTVPADAEQDTNEAGTSKDLTVDE